MDTTILIAELDIRNLLRIQIADEPVDVDANSDDILECGGRRQMG